ncbi:MAG TPA: porin family protein [Tangfeifania sp.]|nr:porin family protein [Tangfeifania sp.]
MKYNIHTYNKTVGIVLLLFTFVLNSTAQDKGNFGIKLGANYMSPYFPTHIEKVGFQGGFFSSIQIYKPVSLQIEMLFSQQGYEEESNGEWSYTINTNYFEIPLIAQFKIIEPVSLYAGGQLGFRSDLEVVKSENYRVVSEPQEPDEFVLSSLGGVALNHGRWGMDLRYIIGFNPSKEHTANMSGLKWFVTYAFK